MVPDADYLYACDRHWWEHHLDHVNEIFTGKKYTQYRTADELKWCESKGLTALKGEHLPGLGKEILHFNANGGAQAINLAYLLGATIILLLGYDMGHTNGQKHWFGDHPRKFHTGNHQHYVPHFDRLAADLKAEGVEVINCTRRTNLTQFPLRRLEDII